MVAIVNSSALVERGFHLRLRVNLSHCFFYILLPWMCSVCAVCGYSRYIPFLLSTESTRVGSEVKSWFTEFAPLWIFAKVISTPRLTGPFGLRPLVQRRRQGKSLKNCFMIKADQSRSKMFETHSWFDEFLDLKGRMPFTAAPTSVIYWSTVHVHSWSGGEQILVLISP